MRVTRLFLVSCASLIFAAPTNAQQAPAPAPTRTVDDYVCAFAGECGKQTGSDDSIAAPSTKGFSLSVPERRTGVTQPSARTTTTSTGRSTVGVAPGRQIASKRGGRALSRAPAAQPGRMDLRISFLLNSAQLTPQAQEEAKVFAKALTLPELAAKRFRIEGHTDSSGSRAMNLDLSRRRAQAVADYLAALGVQSDRLVVRGYGPDRPLPRHRPTSPDNRRVEAQLL